MTMTKEQENKALKNTIEDLKKDILKGLEFNRIKTEKTSEFLKLALDYFIKYRDKSFLISLFFTKAGNTTLFNKLGLRQYFLEQEVFIDYNTKKDKLWIAGNFEEIKESFLEYRERIRKEKQEENKTMSKKEKLLKRFKKSFEGLDNESKKILKSLLG